MRVSDLTKDELDYLREHCDFTEYELLMFENMVKNVPLKNIKNRIINDLEDKGKYYSNFVLDYYTNNIYIITMAKIKGAIKEYKRGDKE